MCAACPATLHKVGPLEPEGFPSFEPEGFFVSSLEEAQPRVNKKGQTSIKGTTSLLGACKNHTRLPDGHSAAHEDMLPAKPTSLGRRDRIITTMGITRIRTDISSG